MIHVFCEQGNGFEFEVWSDCGRHAVQDGRCIGVGKNVLAALRDARRELRLDLGQLEKRIKQAQRGKVGRRE